jgi:hypothetical protein
MTRMPALNPAGADASAAPGWPRNLNFANRPVRTRMTGGAAGVPENLAGPLCRSNRSTDVCSGELDETRTFDPAISS